MMLAKSTNHRRTLFLLWLAAAVLLSITWWHVFSLVKESHDKELATAERDLSNLTRVSQEHADRTFRSADQVIRFIQARYLEIGNRLDLTELSTQGVIDTQIFPQVGVIDAQGIYILANRPIDGKLDLSDREHFKVHVAADSDKLFVSKPVLGRSTGKWSIQLTRRITTADGKFAGVVVVSIDPGYFTNFYSDLKLGGQGIMALYGLDGVARARKIGDKEEFGTVATNSPMFDLIAQGQLEGSFTRRSVVDGVERTYYYRKIPQYSLAVLSGLDSRYLLDNHRRAKEALLLQAVMVSLLILALATALTRYLTAIRDDMMIRLQAQRQIEERNEQLDAIFDLSPNGFVSFDGARHVKYVSPAFSSLTGLDHNELLGLDEASFAERLANRCIPEAHFPEISVLRDKARTGSRKRHQTIELAGSDRRVLEVGLRESQIETVSQILYLRDITHETEVDRMKSEFLSHAAHELRTPMASIYGFTELLITQEFDKTEQREFLDTIYKQSELMISIINELLDLARIEARRGKDFSIAAVDAQALLQDIVTGFKTPDNRASPVTPAAAGPLWIRADRNKLTQAISNVLSNAYKYSPDGGEVDLVLTESPGDGDARRRIGIRIIDHGIGMTPEQLARVCERFYRADTSGKIPGTGLGMSIVKEIVELHGGELEITSEAGNGSTVTIWLPDVRTFEPPEQVPC
jgi:PAS domain S-box-containing protein